MLQNNDLFPNVSNDADRLSCLAMTFTHPDDVLHSRVLSEGDKRAILAAWASDAHAVPNLPAMRQLDSGAIVGIDAVLAALRALDAIDKAAMSSGTRRIGPKPRFTLTTRWRWRPRGEDGGDDPPPSPTAALPPGVDLELRRRRDETWRLAAA